MSKVVVTALRKEFRLQGGVLKALDGIDLSVESGEFVAILGPSGCGKSTLLSIIAGLQAATSGQVYVDGRLITGPGPHCVLMFQGGALFPWLTVRQNVEFGLRLAGMKKKERRQTAEYYIDMVHLSQFADCFIHQLSGGMRQRVALARALALGSDLMLMDEPFASLDELTKKELHDELRKLWSQTGRTVIFVTHDVEEAVALGKRVLILTPRPARIKGVVTVDGQGPEHACAEIYRFLAEKAARSEGERG